ncbi:MAG: ATP-dependent DNA helicase RecG [Nitrospirales bacterium]|nr:ATP-dependent DNA helicase RecG [Nitrospira sp.]MDR4500214.1 ATP-dependent DNA helicase RecG [Nitrospirales bacterium]
MRQESAVLSDVYKHWQRSRMILLQPLQGSFSVHVHSSLPPGPISRNIADQIFELLGQRTFSPKLEADLITLRQVFLDFEEIRAHREREARLTQAQKILKRLQDQARIMTQQSRERIQDTVMVAPERGSDIPDKVDLNGLWNIPVRFGKGIGPNRAEVLKRLGIITVEDALWFLPWRYEDWTEIIPIERLIPDRTAIIVGCVTACRSRRSSRKGMVIVSVSLDDGTGHLDAVFFNQPFLEQIFVPGVAVMLRGEVCAGHSRLEPVHMRAPQYELIREGNGSEGLRRLVPVYHETKGMTSRQFRRIFHGLHERYAESIQEILPERLRSDLGLMTLQSAVKALHFPEKTDSVESLNQGISRAHQRMAFEELLLLQLALAVRRREVKQGTKAIRFTTHDVLMERFQDLMPFKLTESQQRVIQEIQADMVGPTSMNRLLQGDVGSGKTMVALHAMILACGSGYQAVLMAPTEVLSEQHFLTVQPYFRALGLTAVLVKGGQPAQERAKVLKQLELGKAHVAVGTHALLQKEVVFQNLGLVVVDEQHKFGVIQRAVLREKSLHHPDVLVMTATPIPRTLAMTVYGDLDVSLIDTLPPGRKPVQTLVFQAQDRERAYTRLRQEVEAGRQVYVVYPLVEPSEKVDLQAAVEAARVLKEDHFPEYTIGLLHGRMKSKDKQTTMSDFKNGKIDILVTTTVIEVGVDVSNATVIVIEHAERFGLAQLHQLRGRVGRGQDQALCILVQSNIKPAYREKTNSAESRLPFPPHSSDTTMSVDMPLAAEPQMAQESRRLKIFARCQDGFTLAEEDLKIRGPGNVLGEQQWGIMDFRVAQLHRDYRLLSVAKEMVSHILANDPYLRAPELQELKRAMLRKWGKTLDLSSVG